MARATSDRDSLATSRNGNRKKAASQTKGRIAVRLNRFIV
jgi:hypothetical protein